MKRIIAYIYNYREDGNGFCKCGNAGFCRVELRSDKCQITLCFKDIGKVEGEGKIYLLRNKTGDSTFERSDHNRGYNIYEGLLKTKLSTDNCDGIFIECAGEKYAALWSGDVGHISLVDRQETDGEHMNREGMKNVSEPISGHEIDDTCKHTNKNDKINEEYTRIYNRLCKSRMILDDKEYPVVKLRLQDIMMLPRCCWRMTNNCFLMDGYYRYKHILFMEYGGGYVIAVPGVDGDRMDKAAERFGFAEKIYGYEYGHRELLRPYWIKYL